MYNVRNIRTFRVVDPNANLVVYQATSQTTSATFQTNNPKLFAPVVTFSINDIKFLENTKQRFKRTISWKYISAITTQPKKQWFGLSDWSKL